MVFADLSAAREFGIQVQSLPLLCRKVLERSELETGPVEFITLTRADLAAESKAMQESALQKPRRSRPAPSERVGHAWRGPSNAILVPKAP